jgi:hypothetical protein
MKTINEIIILISIIVCSCNTARKVNADFKGYYTKIDTIETPISLTCGSFEVKNPIIVDKQEWAYKSFLGIDTSLTRKYVPRNIDMIDGRIFGNEDKVYIIYGATGDNTYHYLYIYNLNGRVIDSTKLFNGYCVPDEFIETRTHTFIDRNKTITMIDTIKNYTIDSLNKENPRKQTSTTVSKIVLKIENSGEIVKTEETTKEI